MGKEHFQHPPVLLDKRSGAWQYATGERGRTSEGDQLLLNGLLGLFTDLCAAWENGRRLKHLDSDEAFWLFKSEGVTEAERIEALKAK